MKLSVAEALEKLRICLYELPITNYFLFIYIYFFFSFLLFLILFIHFI